MKPEKQSPNFLTCPAFPDNKLPKEKTAARVEARPAVRESYGLKPVQENTPQHLPPTAGKAKAIFWRFAKWGAVLAFSAVIVATAPAVYSMVQAGMAAERAKEALNQAKDKLQRMDVAGALVEVDEADLQLGIAHDSLRNVGFWRDMPGIGVQLRGMEDAAIVGQQTLDGARDLLSIAQTLIEAMQGGVTASGELAIGITPTRRFKDLSKEEKRDLLQKFSAALPKLRIARDKIGLAMDLWSRVPQEELYAPLRTALKPLADNLPSLKQALDESVPLVEAIVPLAGYPEKADYLFLLLNSDEMRPGGGFVGNIGRVSIDAGDISEMKFTDVYNIDKPAEDKGWKETPPQPIIDRLAMKNWFLRDANWSPDFPTSAEKMLDFYIRESSLALGKPLPDAPNAVLALEQGLFKSLLHLTGPITVEGKTFNENDFWDKIQYDVEIGYFKEGVPEAQRKDIVGKIGEVMLAKLQQMPSSRWPEILDLLTKSLERKQIMAYSRSPAVMSVLDQRGWTARAKPTDGDFLWVIDANLAAYKTDGVMDKDISYQVDMADPQGPVATVTLTYTNTNKVIDWRYTRYRSYTRVYVPEGSSLISSSGALKDDRYRTGGVAVPGRVDVMKELGKTVFGAFWSIEPGKTGTLMFKYRLPQTTVDKLANGQYRLDWQKQPGADKTQLTLDLKLGKNIKSAVPAEPQDKWGDDRYEYETDTLVDRAFEIKF
ncbi:DUF4012 domain-containing protein [Candidatus Uhrbacteria bacterium]|nr:DUF4012 domain-containing protein [Candidatus Uhrbacteria bacterium]